MTQFMATTFQGRKTASKALIDTELNEHDVKALREAVKANKARNRRSANATDWARVFAVSSVLT